MTKTDNNNFNITVIIPTYNCREYLPISINSVLEQEVGYDKVQIIIVDDGSTDGTEVVMQSYLDNYPNNIFYYKKENGNWGSVINFVKKNKLAKGKFVTVLDSDDFFCKEAFSEVYQNLDKDMIVSSFYCLTAKGTYVLNPYFGKSRLIKSKEKLRTPHSQPLGKFYSNDLFYNLNDLVEGVWYQDCIFYHNAVSKATSVYYIRKPLGTWYSNRPGNSTTTAWSSNEKFNAWCETLKNMCLNGAGVVVYIYTLLPGFIDALKERHQTIELPCKPSYTWLPKIFIPIFKAYVFCRTKKLIKYPRKNRFNLFKGSRVPTIPL